MVFDKGKNLVYNVYSGGKNKIVKIKFSNNNKIKAIKDHHNTITCFVTEVGFFPYDGFFIALFL
jgi:hypothetical protein